mmetsp:Transcript_11584/g.45006  ORF Transcript_11584/g.45006 Transcript_11584/m.45006 type:complete len:315 (+) Transcript_11584:544-1488(+)
MPARRPTPQAARRCEAPPMQWPTPHRAGWQRVPRAEMPSPRRSVGDGAATCRPPASPRPQPRSRHRRPHPRLPLSPVSWLARAAGPPVTRAAVAGAAAARATMRQGSPPASGPTLESTAGQSQGQAWRRRRRRRRVRSGTGTACAASPRCSGSSPTTRRQQFRALRARDRCQRRAPRPSLRKARLAGGRRGCRRPGCPASGLPVPGRGCGQRARPAGRAVLADGPPRKQRCRAQRLGQPSTEPCLARRQPGPHHSLDGRRACPRARFRSGAPWSSESRWAECGVRASGHTAGRRSPSCPRFPAGHEEPEGPDAG